MSFIILLYMCSVISENKYLYKFIKTELSIILLIINNL